MPYGTIGTSQGFLVFFSRDFFGIDLREQGISLLLKRSLANGFQETKVVHVCFPSWESFKRIRDPYLQSFDHPWWLKSYSIGPTKYNKNSSAGQVWLYQIEERTFLKISYEFSTFWPLVVICLKLLESREGFSVFFCNKIIILVCHFGWCGIL